MDTENRSHGKVIEFEAAINKLEYRKSKLKRALERADRLISESQAIGAIYDEARLKELPDWFLGELHNLSVTARKSAERQNEFVAECRELRNVAENELNRIRQQETEGRLRG